MNNGHTAQFAVNAKDKTHARKLGDKTIRQTFRKRNEHRKWVLISCTETFGLIARTEPVNYAVLYCFGNLMAEYEVLAINAAEAQAEATRKLKQRYPRQFHLFKLVDCVRY